jgi:RNA binding exosome subunit
MTKQEVISQVQNSLGSLFTKDDVINCLNMVVEPKAETKASYPSDKWLAKIKDAILETIQDTDFNDSDMFDISEFEFDIKYGNQIEVDSYEVDACSLKVYVENQIEEAFSELDDEISEIKQQNEETEKNWSESMNPSLKNAMNDIVELERGDVVGNVNID